MRKLLLAFLLPFVLLLSQQGAVTHEIGHIADFVERAGDAAALASAQSAQQAASRDAGQGIGSGTGHVAWQESSAHKAGDLQCEACLAFAHLAGVAAAQVLPPALLSFSFHFAVIEAPAFIAADAPAARSRGPPVFL